MIKVIKYSFIFLFIVLLLPQDVFAASTSVYCEYTCSTSYICMNKDNKNDKKWPDHVNGRLKSNCNGGCSDPYECKKYYQSCTSPCSWGYICTNNSVVPPPVYTCSYITSYGSWTECINGFRTGLDPVFGTKNITNVSECVDPPPIPCTLPACGTSNGGTFATFPTTNLCSAGTVGHQAENGWSYSWSCTSDGSQVWCSANKPVPAACGTSNGGTFATFPTTNLCSAGTVGHQAENGWSYSWSCTSGASQVWCNANKPSAPTYSCLPPLPPSDAQWCNDDNVNLTSNISWISVGTSQTGCTGRKCEYYELPTQDYVCQNKNVSCPQGTSICAGDTNERCTNPNTSWINVGASASLCTARECECYTNSPGTSTTGTNGDGDGADGRMIETRP